MAIMKRNDLLMLGFEEGGGPFIDENHDYIVLQYYIHKDKPWIGIEEHYYPKGHGGQVDAKDVVSAVINYGTKEGEIVYAIDQVRHYLINHGRLPYHKKNI